MTGRGAQETWAAPPDEQAERLYARVRLACLGLDGLPARLEAGLRTALAGLAEDPDLARRLTAGTRGTTDPRALDAERLWDRRFGALLRQAALADPRATPAPDFFAPFLIGGVRFLIARLVSRGETAELLGLLPGTLETLLACYFEPGEPRALAQAALAHGP